MRTGGAPSRELDETDVKRPKNVVDVEFTDSADRALATLAPHTHTTTSDNTSHIAMCGWSTNHHSDRPGE